MEKTEITAAAMLKARGYKLDRDLLTKLYEDNGLEITDNVIWLHEISGAFMVDAYHAGQGGKSLSVAVPWLVKE